MQPDTVTGTGERVRKIAAERADWLVDAVAMATQNRAFLRGEPEEDAVATEAILLNGQKAIEVAIARALEAHTQAFAQGAEGWKTIDSAPRDGRFVVLGAWVNEDPEGDGDPFWTQRVGRWHPPPSPLTEPIYGWRDMGGTCRNKIHPNAAGNRYPTHWTPLPRPPAGKPGGE